MPSILRWKTIFPLLGFLFIFSIIYRYVSTPATLTSQAHKSIFIPPLTERKKVTELPHIQPYSEITEPRQFKFTKECDHFADWPSPSKKKGCPTEYSLKDWSLSIIIYLSADLESVSMQTFLSVTQFIRDSQLIIKNIIITYIDEPISKESNILQINTMMKLTTDLPIIVISSDSEWKAKLEGVRRANSEQVFLVDDTFIVNRGFIQPLLSLLENHPKTLIVPHIDSLLPARIYIPYDDKQLHPDSLVWQETSVGTYSVSPAMNMTRVAHKGINKLPTEMASRGLTGEVFAGKRTQLLSILSKMKTDEPAELSLLAHMCGEGVLVTKCSAGEPIF
ncbi:uncharacterized protein [Watersipora subatra]|uniref:uncharacterized protein isoform X2 n=1 Tax=Watersipora subatra TaxID=2589382 RepID=UPI00355BAC92